MNDYLYELQGFVQDLTSKTNNGLVPWKKANPTTFYWVKEVTSGNIRTIIQRINGSSSVYYRIEVTDIETDEEITSIDTRESNEIQNEIENLYYAIENKISVNQNKRRDVFRELLET